MIPYFYCVLGLDQAIVDLGSWIGHFSLNFSSSSERFVILGFTSVPSP